MRWTHGARVQGPHRGYKAWLPEVPTGMGSLPLGPQILQSCLYPTCCSQTQSHKTSKPHYELEKCEHLPCFTHWKIPRFWHSPTRRETEFSIKENNYLKAFLLIHFLKRFLLQIFNNVQHLFLPSKTDKCRQSFQ